MTQLKNNRIKKTDDNRDVDQFHSTGLLLKERELVLTGDIDEQKLDSFVKNLRLLETKTAPITIYLHTYGGCICSAFAIYDHIRTCNSFITVIGSGHLMSAGALIIQAADDRVCTANTSVLLHEGYTGITETLTHANMKAAANWEDNLIYRAKVIIAERMSEMLKKKIHECYDLLTSKTSADWFMFADEAASYGIIDRVI